MRTILNQADNNGATPLHIAAYKENFKAVDELLKELTKNARFNYLEQKTIEGVTPLYIAAKTAMLIL